MTPGGPAGLLAAVPFGGLLSLVLRVAVCADRRDEFLGDLIEEALLRQARSSRAQVAVWVWTETLRSLPALLGLRLRRLGGALLAGRGPTPARAGGAVLVGSRGAHRGLPLSLGLSFGAHALLVAGGMVWLFSRVEEVGDPPLEFVTPLSEVVEIEALVPPALTTGGPVAASAPLPRRGRTIRRALPSVGTAPATGPTPGPALPGAVNPAPTALTALPPTAQAPGNAGDGRGPVALPPRIADKRCLTCPPPQLHPAYARLARGQDMLIRTCVSTKGDVTRVDVVRGFDATVSREVVATVRHWRLVPYLLDGHPVPFCYATRFIFANG